MPTAKPRITITLTDHQHAVLSELAKLQKASMSSIVVELIDTTLPVLERLSHVLSDAASAPQTVLAGIRKSAEIAQADMLDLSTHTRITGLLDQLLERSNEGDAPTATVGRRGAAPETQPPTSNRGVRITSPRPKNGPFSPMKKAEKNGRVQK